MTDARSALSLPSPPCRRGALTKTLPVLGIALLFAAALSLAPSEARAQTRGDGSTYSRFGLGDLRHFSSAQAQAMGGGGIALRSLNYTGFSNPALWSDQQLTRLSIGGRYRRLNAENEAGQNSILTEGDLQAVQFSFPLLAGELGVGLGFQPFSRVEYRVQNAPQPLPGDTSSFSIRFEGEGGLQQISGGLGYRIGDALSIGARADVVFGILEDQRRTTFDDPSRFRSTTLVRRTRLAGVTGTAGALLSLSGVLTSDDALSIGATFTLPTRLSGERARTLGENLDRDTLSTEEDGNVDLPLRTAFGLAYKPDARWTIIADGEFAPWSSAQSDFALPGFNALRDRSRASAGVEFLPAGEDRNESYLQRTAYRLGAYYEQSYVDAATIFSDGASAPDTGINTLAATGGLSLPTPAFGTRIDIGVEVGTRGTADDGLVRELFYGLSLSVNIGERWFQRRRLR